jgi:hypothetical protein
MDDEKPVRGYRANSIIIDDEFPWTQELFEEVMAGFVKTDPRPFSEEVKIISTPKEFEVKNDT